MKYIISGSSTRKLPKTVAGIGRVSTSSAILLKSGVLPGYYNALNICHGDGVTDDTNHILAAIASYKAAGQSGVYFPAGTYYLASRLTIPANTVLVGAGMGSVWLKGPVRPGSVNNISAMRIGADYYDTAIWNASNITFENVKFHGGGGTSTIGNIPNPAHVITIGSTWSGGGYSVSNVTFDGCTFERNVGVENSAHGLNYVGVSFKAGTAATDSYVDGVLFRDCIFEIGAPNFTVEMWQWYAQVCRVGMTDVSFEGCTFYPGSCASIDYSGGLNAAGEPSTGYAHITGCEFRGNGAGTNPMWFNDITIEKGAGYVDISGNTFYRGAGCAMRCEDGGGHNTFIGNTVDLTNTVLNTGITHWALAPVIIDSGNHSNTITGNTINNTGNTVPYSVDLAAGSSYNVVTGNTFIGGGVRNNGTNNTVSPNP